VVDDDLSVRKSLERAMRAAGLVVSTFASAEDYLEHYDPNAPGCLVLDLAMPGFSGLQLQDALAARGSAPPIIFLTGHAEVPDSVRAMKHGAVEFLTKPVNDNTLIDAIRNAFEKDAMNRAKRDELAEIHRRLALLTPRESQVLGYVVSGRLNKMIAAELGIVEKTIKVHRARLIQKMQVSSLAELVQIAGRSGIASTPRL
jgi:FixJ family two-component response regulator